MTEYEELRAAGLPDHSIRALRNTGASHKTILAWAKQYKSGGLVGFPSAFAAFKYLDATAAGPCSWKLNGESRPQAYDPELRAEDEGQRWADERENNSPRCVW